MRYLAVIRHADYNGTRSDSPLSDAGKKMAHSLSKHLDEWLRRERVSSVVGFCSKAARTQETLMIAIQDPDAVVVMDSLGLIKWENVDTGDVFRRIAAHSDIEQGELALVVSHGDAPYFLLQTAFAKHQSGNPPRLPTTNGTNSDYACGFLLDTESGVVYGIHPFLGLQQL